VLTEIHDAYEGDTRFPAWDRDAWVEVDRDERAAFDFVTYERRE
jgi:dihydrofolate reductase